MAETVVNFVIEKLGPLLAQEMILELERQNFVSEWAKELTTLGFYRPFIALLHYRGYTIIDQSLASPFMGWLSNC
ncbi:hypothetical protein WN943_002319 [Citrus x changshan-huyou]